MLLASPDMGRDVQEFCEFRCQRFMVPSYSSENFPKFGYEAIHVKTCSRPFIFEFFVFNKIDILQQTPSRII